MPELWAAEGVRALRPWALQVVRDEIQRDVYHVIIWESHPWAVGRSERLISRLPSFQRAVVQALAQVCRVGSVWLNQATHVQQGRPNLYIAHCLDWLFAGAMLMRSFEFTGEHDPRVTVCLSPWISMPRRE